MDNLAKLNASIRRSVNAALRHEAALTAAYRAVLNEASTTAADRLERATSLASAGQPAGWVKPTADDLYDLTQTIRALHAAGEPITVQVVTSIMDNAEQRLGFNFELRQPAIDGVLKQLGRQITHIAEDHRAQIMQELDTAWQDGLSIPDAAAALTARMSFLDEARSTLIARTELAGATNGGAIAAATASGVATAKVWMTALGAKYPRHEEYDELDQQTVGLDAAFMVGDAQLQYPGDPDGPPEEVCNCRCTVAFTHDQYALEAAATVRPPTITTTTSEDSMPRKRLVTSPKPRRLPLRLRLRPTGGLTLIIRHLTAAGEDGRVGWEGDMMFVDTPTGDGREYAADGLSWRDLPLPLMAMFEDDHGTGGMSLASVNVGQIETLKLDGKVVKGTGTFNPDEETGMRAARAVQSGDMPGVSVDPSATRWEVSFPPVSELEAHNEDGDPVDDQELIDAFWGENEETVIIEESLENQPSIRFLDWQIMGATLVPFPAFADAKLSTTSDVPEAVAAAGILAEDATVTVPEAVSEDVLAAVCASLPEGAVVTEFVLAYSEPEPAEEDDGVTASAAGLTEDAPPRSWFYRAEPSVLTPLTVLPSGEVYGHLAAWDSCHIGYEALSKKNCITAPASTTDYAHFHQRRVQTGEGTVECGAITVGLTAGHADSRMDRFETVAHYDRTGAVAAHVRCTDGQLGPWLSGAVCPEATRAQVKALSENAVSGDWRRVPDHGLELVASLSVPVPGFPLVASAVVPDSDDTEVIALVASPVPTGAQEAVSRRRTLNRVRAMAARAHGGTEALARLAHDE